MGLGVRKFFVLLAICAVLVMGSSIAYSYTEVIEDFEFVALARIAWATWANEETEVSLDFVEQPREPGESSTCLQVSANGTLCAFWTNIQIEEGAKSLSFWVKVGGGEFGNMYVSITQSKGGRIGGRSEVLYADIKDGEWAKYTLNFTLDETDPQGVFKWNRDEEPVIFFPLIEMWFDVVQPKDCVIYIDDIVVEYQ